MTVVSSLIALARPQKAGLLIGLNMALVALSACIAIAWSAPIECSGLNVSEWRAISISRRECELDTDVRQDMRAVRTLLLKTAGGYSRCEPAI